MPVPINQQEKSVAALIAEGGREKEPQEPKIDGNAMAEMALKMAFEACSSGNFAKGVKYFKEFDKIIDAEHEMEEGESDDYISE